MNGISGINFNKKTGKYRSRINCFIGVIYLGEYDSFDEAGAAKKGAQKLLNFFTKRRLKPSNDDTVTMAF